MATNGARSGTSAVISLTSERGYAQYAANFGGNGGGGDGSGAAAFRLSLRFKTLAPSGLLVALISNETSTSGGELEVLAALELVRGRIRYRFGRRTSIVVPAIGGGSGGNTRRRPLNDLRWHTISVEQVKKKACARASRQKLRRIMCRRQAASNESHSMATKRSTFERPPSFRSRARQSALCSSAVCRPRCALLSPAIWPPSTAIAAASALFTSARDDTSCLASFSPRPTFSAAA